jgi:hypothetical protein
MSTMQQRANLKPKDNDVFERMGGHNGAKREQIFVRRPPAERPGLIGFFGTITRIRDPHLTRNATPRKASSTRRPRAAGIALTLCKEFPGREVHTTEELEVTQKRGGKAEARRAEAGGSSRQRQAKKGRPHPYI